MTASIDLRRLGLLGTALAGSALAIVCWVLLAYSIGPPAAIGALAALAVAVAAIRSPLAGVCLAVLAAPLEFLATELGGGSFSLTPSESILLLTAASATPRLLLTLTANRVPTAIYAFAGLIVVSITGLFHAVETFAVIRIVVDWVAFGVIALYISQRNAAELRMVAISLAVACGVLGAMTLGSLTEQRAVAGGAIIANRAAANFAHPTTLALFLLLTFPLAFALAARARSTAMRLSMALCGVLGVVGVLASQTRGSMIAAAVALLWLISRWPQFRRAAFAILALLAIIVAVNFDSVTSSQPVTVLTSRLDTLSLESQGDDRLEIWAATPNIIASAPLLGVGQGNFPAVSPAYGLKDVGGLPFDHAHNLFLNVSAELGLAGLILLLALIGSLFATARDALAERRSELHPLAVALSASLLAVLVNSLSEYPLRSNLILATLLIDIGILLGIRRLLDSADLNSRAAEPAD